MDEKDKEILKVLERNAKLSSRALAVKVGLPTSTVHRRVQKLEREGVIKGYRTLIDYEKTERPIGAYLFISEAETIPNKGHIPKARIIDEIRKFSEVQEISDVQGANFDLIAKARFKSLKGLSDFTENLRSIEGIEGLFAAIIIEEIS